MGGGTESHGSMAEGMRVWSMNGVETLASSINELMQLDGKGSAEMSERRSERRRGGVRMGCLQLLEEFLVMMEAETILLLIFSQIEGKTHEL